ncbi:hypothetical protein EC968_009188 [Mortierella alpina]|nr:hypothetical protein EC968_009188 [Mortierella alpina]
MIRRLLRTSTKAPQPSVVQLAVDTTPLDSKAKCMQPLHSSTPSVPATAPFEATDGSTPLLPPSTLSTKSVSSENATKASPASKPQGSLTRVKQTLTRKINARRVGAEPRSSSSRESTSSTSSASDARSQASSPRPSTDSDAQPSAADPTLDRSQSKLKRWQTRSTNKLKTWLNVQPTQREPITVNDDQGQPEVKQGQAEALEPTPAARLPDLEMQSAGAATAIQKLSDRAESLVMSEDLLPLSGPSTPQDPKLQHRRRAAGDETRHDPIERVSLCSTDQGARRVSIVDSPARCLAKDEDETSTPLDLLETYQRSSVDADGPHSTQQADRSFSSEIPRGMVTDMLFSVNPLLKARWQPKSTVYALSAIDFWSSLHRQESLVV